MSYALAVFFQTVFSHWQTQLWLAVLVGSCAAITAVVVRNRSLMKGLREKLRLLDGKIAADSADARLRLLRAEVLCRMGKGSLGFADLEKAHLQGMSKDELEPTFWACCASNRTRLWNVVVKEAPTLAPLMATDAVDAGCELTAHCFVAPMQSKSGKARHIYDQLFRQDLFDSIESAATESKPQLPPA